MRHVVAGVLALALLAVLSASASAALRARDAGPLPTGVVSADERHLASSDRVVGDADTSSAVTVRDLATGRSRSIPTPRGCRFAAVGGGALLWSCLGRGSAENGLVHDLRSGEWRAYAPVPPQYGIYESARFVDIGTRWLRVDSVGFHGASQDEFIDRETGRWRLAGELRGDRKRRADLDSPRLVQTLCRGLARPLAPSVRGPAPGLEAADLAMHGSRAASTTHRDAKQFPGRVVLRRCGDARMRTLARCRDDRWRCAQPVIDARRVAWIERRWTGTAWDVRVRVHGLRSHRTRALALPAPSTGGLDPRVWLVRNRLFATNGDRLFRITGG